MPNLVTDPAKSELNPTALPKVGSETANFTGNHEAKVAIEKAQRDAIKKENATLKFNPLAALDFQAIEGFIKNDPRSSYNLDVRIPKEAAIHEKVKKHIVPHSHVDTKVHVDVFTTLGGREKFATVTVQGVSGERITPKGIGFEFEGANQPLSQTASQNVPGFEKALRAFLLKNGQELRTWQSLDDARVKKVKEDLRKTLGVNGEIKISAEKIENRLLAGKNGQKRETFGTIVQAHLSDGRGIMMGNLVAKEGGNHLLIALKGFDAEKLLATR